MKRLFAVLFLANALPLCADEPFSFADFTWLNGNSRQHTPVFDFKAFTGEVRVDTNYVYDCNHPRDHTLVGSSELGRTPYFTANPGDPFRGWDASATFDYMPNDNITFRYELNHRASSVPYWAGAGGVTPAGGNSGPPGSFVDGFRPDLRKSETRLTAAILVKF